MGSMIGFYLMAGSKPNRNSSIFHEVRDDRSYLLQYRVVAVDLKNVISLTPPSIPFIYYLIPLAPCSLVQGRAYDGSPMVPTHEVSTPLDFILESGSEDDVFTIMPTTFEPGKTGPFFLSIATDVEFSFRRLAHILWNDKRKEHS